MGRAEKLWLMGTTDLGGTGAVHGLVVYNLVRYALIAHALMRLFRFLAEVVELADTPS